MRSEDKRIKRGKETKEKIIVATTKLFSKKGYDGTSIKDITDQSRIPKSLFYHYFKSKSEVLEYMIESYFLGITENEKKLTSYSSIDRTFEQVLLRILQNAFIDSDMLRIIMMESLKNEKILLTVLGKMEKLRNDFYSILPEHIVKTIPTKEVEVFGFYFRFIPMVYFILSNEVFSKSSSISEIELRGIFEKLISSNPYLENICKFKSAGFNSEVTPICNK